MAYAMSIPVTVSKVALKSDFTGSRTIRAAKPCARVSKRSVSVRCSDENVPVPTEEAVAAAAPAKTETFAMNFNGFAPETINGRLAQIGFVAGLGAEIATGDSFATQFHDHPVAFGFACTLITAASFMPTMNQATKYTSNPESVPNQGAFNSDVEKLNGRAAMIGMVAMLATEYLKGGALFG